MFSKSTFHLSKKNQEPKKPTIFIARDIFLPFTSFNHCIRYKCYNNEYWLTFLHTFFFYSMTQKWTRHRRSNLSSVQINWIWFVSFPNCPHNHLIYSLIIPKPNLKRQDYEGLFHAYLQKLVDSNITFQLVKC